MAGTSIAGGGPQAGDALKAMNQSMGQLMTMISNQKQIAAMEKQQDQNVFDANFLKNPALMKMNAQEDNAAFRMGMEKYHGLSGDAYELWRTGINNMALLPKDQGTFQMMQGWKEGVEGDDWSRLMGIGSSMKGEGLDLPQITDRLDKGFAPTAPETGITPQPVVTTEPVVTTTEEEDEIEVEPKTAPVPQLGADDPTRPGSVVLPGEKTITPEIFKPVFDTGGPQRDPITGQIIQPMGADVQKGLEQPAGVVLPGVEEKAKDLEMDPASLDKSIREENLFKIQEQKRQELDVTIQNLETQLQSVPRNQRETPQYKEGLFKLQKLKDTRNDVSLRNQITGRSTAFIQTGANMSKFAVGREGREIDQPTEKYVREMEVIESDIKDIHMRERIVPGKEAAYLENKVRGTMEDRKIKDIVTLLEKTPGIVQQLESAARGQVRELGPLTPPEREKGAFALRSLTQEALPNKEKRNILNGLSKVDPAVLGEFFPTVFDRQLQLNDQEIRVAQQRINSKLANTQQYQVMMQAYYQSAKDQMASNDPAAAIAFELSMMTLEVLSKSIDWNEPKKAREAWASGLETIGLAKAGTVIAEDVFGALGIKFKDITLTRSFFEWIRGRDPLTIRSVDLGEGFVQDTKVLGDGVFDPDKFVE